MHIPSFQRRNWKQELRNILTESKIAMKLNLKLECHYIIIIGYGMVVSIWRYPVKSMMGEELNSSYLTERGLTGDRTYALIDQNTGKVASTKNPREWGKLFDSHAKS